ncbi:hypothetical protein [Streptomyces sp. NPDC005538]|uniref:hypothetical protein n=1 Tax=unclassified Streptomyces TaxID=2593676 RepID=UPI00339F7AA6
MPYRQHSGTPGPYLAGGSAVYGDTLDAPGALLLPLKVIFGSATAAAGPQDVGRLAVSARC